MQSKIITIKNNYDFGIFRLNFKKYAKYKLNIKTVDCDGKLCKIEHIGKSTDYESVKSSFIEFYIISKAKYIKTISDYDWVSNFIKWPSLIYDVPLEIHKKSGVISSCSRAKSVPVRPNPVIISSNITKISFSLTRLITFFIKLGLEILIPLAP